MVDGVTVATGRYPARDRLLRYAGLASVAAPAGVTELGLTAVTGDSCGPAGCCEGSG
jgi:arsenite-transporting ATPase